MFYKSDYMINNFKIKTAVDLCCNICPVGEFLDTCCSSIHFCPKSSETTRTSFSAIFSHKGAKSVECGHVILSDLRSKTMDFISQPLMHLFFSVTSLS